ncbi:hypothetical protein UA08_02694 [Talaromyces atroroseus]|uniref:Holocytochrome c-type synthase n=1 Tax=Talaromyces atroroseus TaxID=1441469 RepID=A0A225B389_TALAT|nr:hypothetical protein UA08_02694 [Talaromyces atroroseus]OKL62469.1 hypothetical protein UA08_02694 [Talaromyces atroroseus]
MATRAAHKRLTREYQNIQKNPPPFIVAHPSETNILESGSLATKHAEDILISRVVQVALHIDRTAENSLRKWPILGYFDLPTGIPFRATGYSISDFHPKSFNPAWEVSTILIGLLSFMTSEEMTTGSVSASDSERRLFAARSRWWNSTGGGSQSNIPAGVTTSSRGINNIKAGDGGLKFRTEWPELDEENWKWIKDNRIDAATGHIIPDPNSLTSNNCSPETSAFRRRPIGSGPRLGAVMGGGQVAREAGQGWSILSDFQDKEYPETAALCTNSDFVPMIYLSRTTIQTAMGWFWADSQRPAAMPATTPSTAAAPPPACPMHQKDSASQVPSTLEASQPSACPVKRSPNSPFYTPPPSQPQQQSSSENQISNAESSSSSNKSRINPLNYMFSFISQERAPSQTVDLPVDREISSIPRADGAGGNWEYPSPQQMYNAMLRKGYTDTPQDAVESMVAVHNFLNEGAWAEIVEWEQIFSKGLGSGWEKCKRGNENLAIELAKERIRNNLDEEQPSLVRFQGRPQDLSPRARIMQALGWLYPAKFGTEPPFDRHDWYVSRQTPSGTKEVRYVIDYYSGPPEPTGEPVFFLDIRPAVDTPTAAVERLMRWGGDVWWRASGGQARENK